MQRTLRTGSPKKLHMRGKELQQIGTNQRPTSVLDKTRFPPDEHIYIYNMSQSYPIIISLISSNFSSFICTKEELDSLTVYYTGFPKMREPFSPCIGLYCFTNSILANLRAHFGVSQNKKLALGGPWRYGSKWG